MRVANGATTTAARLTTATTPAANSTRAVYNLGMRLGGKTVLVTGGASGLGGATSDIVVAAGGHVVIVDINEQTGHAKAAALGERARFVKADVTSEGDV